MAPADFRRLRGILVLEYFDGRDRMVIEFDLPLET